MLQFIHTGVSPPTRNVVKRRQLAAVLLVSANNWWTKPAPVARLIGLTRDSQFLFSVVYTIRVPHLKTRHIKLSALTDQKGTQNSFLMIMSLINEALQAFAVEI